jgi:hypothetical protein
MQFQGKVARQHWGGESKSAHEAVVLLTPEGALKLRRVGGNPFADPELDRLVGKEIQVEGEVRQNQLVMANWHEIGST